MKRLELLVVLIAAVTVAGCEPKKPDHLPAVKDGFRAFLKDPDWVTLQNVRDLGATVCGEYNAKNSFGGYVGYKPFYARIDDSGQAEVFTADHSSLGPFFEKVHKDACADRSSMTPAEASADLQRRLDENQAVLDQLQEKDASASAPPLNESPD